MFYHMVTLFQVKMFNNPSIVSKLEAKKMPHIPVVTLKILEENQSNVNIYIDIYTFRKIT